MNNKKRIDIKELSVEEKAKRYDEAIEKAKKVKDNPFAGYDGSDVISYLFPELKESEDERIKVLIGDALCDSKLSSEEVQDVLAWLEAQGEQKPADNAEPKFKKGDWVIYCGKPYQITGLHNDTFTLTSCDGSYFFNNVKSTKEPVFHLWTIQDAKDGDVIVDKSDGTIGIFQSLGHHPDGGSYNDPSYCFLHCRYDDGFFFADFENGNTMDSDDAIPATKEQRDTLMKAMTDAGYEWDAEKKELKKIEKKPDSGGFWEGYNTAKEKFEQKPAWSEEDETTKNNISHIIRQYDKISKRENQPCWYVGDSFLWMQNIKDRVLSQPKQEWSEEDELMLTSIIQTLKLTNGAAQMKIDWLKSLRPQNRWKPSDEQMDALESAIVDSISSIQKHSLESLYNELKKLF